MLTYVDAGSSSAGIAVVVTVSGTTISLGSSYTFNASSTNSGFVRVIKLDNSNIF
ncbi:hypothetical protein [Caloramator sp. Dgby_cultured_2]|uniref:hypothetical protein n=1 Tax=Caloramator sp. Dgby_cultured_2 TaxID=3029174 RepID=UPI00237E03FC|nr:hypothetical protein [Caloramator sp. Dgby_cultured_2]WDU82259.1 hypothetical protein PWK10_11170 [Caloramator sp. Dgby_cultured_2]